MLFRSVLDTLDDKQRTAVKKAMSRAYMEHRTIDIQFSFLGRFYAIAAGKDLRSKERRDFEKAAHPLRTKGNMAFLLFWLFLLSMLPFIGSIISTQMMRQ